MHPTLFFPHLFMITDITVIHVPNVLFDYDNYSPSQCDKRRDTYVVHILPHLTVGRVATQLSLPDLHFVDLVSAARFALCRTCSYRHLLNKTNDFPRFFRCECAAARCHGCVERPQGTKRRVLTSTTLWLRSFHSAVPPAAFSHRGVPPHTPS